ncbi:MAG: hypothetical protein ACKOBG_09795 [Actinomycetota bacterium]
MRVRTGLILICALAALAAVGCSSKDSNSSDSTTTTTAAETPTTEGPIGGNVLPPVVLSPEETSATVKVETVVTFDMGDPGAGEFVAVSSDPAVFDVTGPGRTEAGATYNAAGKATAPGEATVTVSYRGSANGVGTPTTFTITVEAAG